MPVARGLQRAVQVGARTFLRRPGRADREEFLALREASREFLARWEPRPVDGRPPDFDAYLNSARSPRIERLLLCRTDGGAVLGAINLNEITRGAFQSAYLGYWIGAAHAGRGHMTEGLRLALAHAFTTVELHRVEANIQPNNAPSLALVRRAGFRREGFSPRYLKIDGRWADHERWALTVEDWLETEGVGDRTN